VRRYQLSPLIEFLKQTRITKITTPLVEAYKQRRVTEVSKTTVNDELKVLSVVLAYARHLGVPCASPKITKYAISKRKGHAKAYTREEVGYILAGATAVAVDFGVMVRFLAETGCRKSEAINLPWARVDLKRGMAKIWSDAGDAEDDDDEYEVKSRDREVTLSDGLVLVLKEQKLRAGGSAWVFPVRTDRASKGEERHTKGERYANWPKYTWARALAKATGLAKKANPRAPAIAGGPHRLRHTFASLFLEKRPDLFALGRVLGHSHTRVTELYSHLLPDHLATTRNVVVFDAPAQNHPQTTPKGGR
jgi:integrase